MSKNSQAKTGLGSALATLGALFMVLSSILGWYSNPSTWLFPLTFAMGAVAGLGTALAVSGLIESKRER